MQFTPAQKAAIDELSAAGTWLRYTNGAYYVHNGRGRRIRGTTVRSLVNAEVLVLGHRGLRLKEGI